MPRREQTYGRTPVSQCPARPGTPLLVVAIMITQRATTRLDDYYLIRQQLTIRLHTFEFRNSRICVCADMHGHHGFLLLDRKRFALQWYSTVSHTVCVCCVYLCYAMDAGLS